MALGDKERAQELIEKNSSETVKYYEENTRQIHLAANKKDGESVAFLEVPKYIPEEIEKAIDIGVDELVRNRKDLPAVVLKSVYDEVVADLATANARITELETNVQDLTSQLIAMTADRDTQLEQRIAAETALAELENLYIALSDQFRETVLELQKAIERSTQEAVERVSLEARFEALRARLEASLLAIEAQQAQIEAEIETNYLNSSLQQEKNNFAYKIPAPNITNPQKGGLFINWDYGNYKKVNGGELVFYNFTEQPMTVSVSKVHPQGHSGQPGTISLPSSFSIPAGIGYNEDLGKTATPGATSINCGFKRPGGWKEDNTTGWRRYPTLDITFTNNKGDSLELFYSYSRDYKVKAYAQDNPGPRVHTVEEGVDVSATGN